MTEITAQRIAQYDRDRVTQTSRLGRLVTASTVNRELAILRHMLRLAEEWGYIAKVPKIRLSKEPEGRLRFLSEDEIERLLVACEDRRRKSPYLLPIVTIALNTGMRKREILGLTWEHVDFARGVLLLEQTKNGRRREVPMNRAVYDAFQPLYATARAALQTPAPGKKAAEPAGLVFRKRRGDASWGSIRTAFEGACREAKIPDFRRVVAGDEGEKPQGSPGTARPPRVHHDASLRPRESRPAARRRRQPRRVQHKISTKR